MLAGQLASHYKTTWVPEYSREYLEVNGSQYREDDILNIARGQLERETLAMKTAEGFLFCDTEFIVTKIWSEFKYGRCHPWIIQQVEQHAYDLFLLCDIDIPWENDPLREHPGRRKELFELYCSELVSRGFPFFVVRGLGIDRLNNAIALINEYFSNKIR
ncbi:MAG: ATPase [Bacteroidetes bacterium]|nr:MAG: ATPase [Bacteroidota bacterium]